MTATDPGYYDQMLAEEHWEDPDAYHRSLGIDSDSCGFCEAERGDA